jgi:dihydroxy-acid dehydratase
MGAISADVPAIQLVTGPMLTGSHRGRKVGACTDCRSYWKMFRAQEIDLEEIWRVNDQLVPTVGVSCSSYEFHSRWGHTDVDLLERLVV